MTAATGMITIAMWPPWARIITVILLSPRLVSGHTGCLGSVLLPGQPVASPGPAPPNVNCKESVCDVLGLDELGLQRLLHLRRGSLPRRVLEDQQAGDGQLGLAC